MILTATQGSLKHDEVNRAVKAVFPQGRCMTAATRTKDVYAAEDADPEEIEETTGADEENEVF